MLHRISVSYTRIISGYSIRRRSTIASIFRSAAVASRRFATPGRFTLSVDGANVTVDVRRPARANVTALTVDSDRVTRGESVLVTATVENRADVPGEASVVFTTNYEETTQREVKLGPNEMQEVTVSITLDRVGDVLVSAGGAKPVAVTVVGETTTATVTDQQTGTAADRTTDTAAPPPDTETTGGIGPGFGIPGAIAALGLAAWARRRF